jgi:hypothetical protein
VDIQYQVRERTLVTKELVVTLPVDWKNFDFVVSRVRAELSEAKRVQYDDACEVTAGDDQLIFTWPVSNVTT